MKRKCRIAVLILGLLLLTTGCHNADEANATGKGQEVTDTDLAEEKDGNELAEANDEKGQENTETDQDDQSADSQKDDAKADKAQDEGNPLQAHGSLSDSLWTKMESLFSLKVFLHTVLTGFRNMSMQMLLLL